MKSTSFRLSLISVALFSSFAYADPSSLEVIDVVGSNTASNWQTVNQRNVSSLKEALADSVDINLGGGSASAQYMSIRGAGQNRIDLIVDNTTTGTQQWYHQGRFQFDPIMLKTIEIDKGAGSASAGIGVTSGAVRAQTVDAKDLLLNGKSFGAKIGTDISSNKGNYSNVALYGNSQGIDALILGSWRDDRNYKDGNHNEVLNSARKQGNYLAKLGYQISDHHHIGLSHRQERYYGNSAERPEFAFIMDEGSITTQQNTTNFDYKGRQLGLMRDIDFNVFHIRGEDERTNFQRRRGSDNKRVTLKEGERLSKTKTTGANLGLTSELSTQHLLKYGLNWRKEQNASQNPTLGKVNGERKNEYGAYIEGIWGLDKVTLTTGLRYDHFVLDTTGKPNSKANKHASKGKLNPSVSAIWDITDSFSLNAKWNYASRSPSLSSAVTVTDNRAEKPTDTPRGQRDVDANLKIEQSRLLEVGFKWLIQDLTLTGSLFEQNVKNFYSSVTSSPVTNLGTVKTKGYELEAAYQWQNLTAKAGVSYADPKANFDLSNSPLDVVPQGRQWKTSLAYRFMPVNLELGWRGRYAQGVSYQTGKTMQTRVGYGVHDIFLNWKPMGENININASINNIGNKHYVSHSQRASTATPPERGREYRLGINYRF